MWLADPSSMHLSAGEKIGLGGFILTLLAFLADRVLRPWRDRSRAHAKERQIIAEVTSDEVRRALRVLTGDEGDPEQGVEPRKGVGKRLEELEASNRRIHDLLNGGGLGAKIDQHLEEAATHYADLVSKQDEIVTRLDALTEDVRDARSDTADTAVAAANALQRLDERFTEEVIAARTDTEKLRLAVQSMAQELGQESDTLPPGIPSVDLGDD